MKDTILRYYCSELVNPNNRQSIKGSEINSRIEELRDILSRRFSWEGKGHIAFLPNAHYAKKTLLYFLFNGQSFGDMGIFSNSRKVNHHILEVEENLSVEYVSSWGEISSPHFAVFSHGGMDAPVSRGEGQYLFVEMDSEDLDAVKNADAFIFNAAPGVSVFGFRSNMKMDSVILGSGSVKYADDKAYVLSEDFRCLECGTPNVPMLLAIREIYKNK